LILVALLGRCAYHGSALVVADVFIAPASFDWLSIVAPGPSPVEVMAL
jgi:hypothetical protein